MDNMIAERIGVSPATALSHVKKLCDAGYLKDLTPGRRNKPHVYQDTGRVQMLVGMSAHSVDEREYSVDEREYSSPKRHVQESELKIVSKRVPKKVNKTAGADGYSAVRAQIARRALHLFGTDRERVIADRINELLEDHSEQEVLKAFDKAVDANAANWNYINVVLGDRSPRESTRQRDPKPTGRVPQWS